VAEAGSTDLVEVEPLGDVRRRADLLAYVGSADVSASFAGGRLRLARPLPIRAGDRIVLRDTGRGETIGGAVVQPAPEAVAPPEPTPESWEDSGYLARLQAAPFDPPPPDGVDPAELRHLARSGLAVSKDGCWFAETAVDAAARVAATFPDGFTVGELRQALRTNRRCALALVGLLDERGVTRRDGDRRVARG
jgi:hypothetical protein